MYNEDFRHRTVRGLTATAVVLLLLTTGYLTVKKPYYRKGYPSPVALLRIAEALAMYSQDVDVYAPEYPENLGVLLNLGYIDGEYLVCRRSITDIPSTNIEVVEGQTDFMYVHKPFDQYNPDDPIVFTKPPRHGIHQCSVLLSDLRTVKNYQAMPEYLQQYISSDQVSEYGHPSRIENIYDMFRPLTFFVIIAGIIVFAGVYWGFDVTGKTGQELRRFILPIIPILVLALIVFWGFHVPAHTGSFKYHDLAYQGILRLFVLLFGAALSLLIVIKDRCFGVRVLSVILFLSCLLLIPLIVKLL